MKQQLVVVVVEEECLGHGDVVDDVNLMCLRDRRDLALLIDFQEH
jgi:hypothetical protein